MQNSREASLLKEFYSRHKSIIDALAEDDEMFRAVKEAAEAEDAAVGKDFKNPSGGIGRCPL